MPAPIYVNSGTPDRNTVSAEGVSGLNLAMPANLVVGNLLVIQALHRASAALLDDAVQVTQPSGVWRLIAEDPVPGGTTRHFLWCKKVTSTNEPAVRLLVSTVGVLGNGAFVGAIHQFGQVRSVPVTFIEGLSATSRAASGPLDDTRIVVSGPNRLALNFTGSNNTAVGASAAPAGETGGNWVLGFAAVTGLSPQIRLWYAPMLVAGSSIDGGSCPGTAGTWETFTRGFALAGDDEAGATKPETGGGGAGSGQRHRRGRPLWLRGR